MSISGPYESWPRSNSEKGRQKKEEKRKKEMRTSRSRKRRAGRTKPEQTWSSIPESDDNRCVLAQRIAVARKDRDIGELEGDIGSRKAKEYRLAKPKSQTFKTPLFE
jgi:hypothetical protein